MKKIISALAIGGIAIFTSCNTSSHADKNAALVAQQNTIDSLKLEFVKQHVVDSMNEVAKTTYMIPQVVNAPPTYVVKRSTATKRVAAKKTKARQTKRNVNYANNQEPVYQNQQPVYQPQQTVYQENPAPTPQKKGWSAKAKGAVIGAGAGAVAGAVINKRNRAAGAVIGGVLGAGAGTGIGAIIDKKKGR